MSKEASRSNRPTQVEQDLLNALLKAEGVIVNGDEFELLDEPQSNITYPWNPADPASEAFFNQLEQDLVLALSDSEVAERSQAFSRHIDQLFSATSLQTSLAHKFANVPQELLNAIARQAQQVAQTTTTLADQLVQCVQDVLPQWAEDDLRVLARPLAYAMRGDEAASSLPSATWDDLSETEQARMSLAIARYAIDLEAGKK
ncbi:hypothetical protein [Myxacorys almedinensis]|uniref:Uncharacterized protein n=1 Tax=Myxacorys almedinensis A TaxID=2690445 RepID=A0A8J8CIG5_9CYAN|nr:hypothetical protein [Myxacorys almedinensis]NDJ17689.1 hypothetical protein [Myxacorys almedinensis A]